MRVLVVSLSTYTSGENRSKLDSVAQRVSALSVISGDVPTMWGNGESVANSSDSSAYELRVLPCRFRWSWSTRFLKNFGSTARRARPDVIHVEAEPWQVVALQAVAYARRRRIPIGIQFPEDGPQFKGFRGRIRQRIAAIALKRCSYAIGWTSHSADWAKRLAPEVRVLTMPGTGVADWQIDPQVSDDSAETRRWFGDGSVEISKLAFVGRLLTSKGVPDLMSICDGLAERLDLRVAIAGTGACEPAVLSWARTRPWVSFHGLISRREASRCLGCADAVLVPSRSTPTWQEQFGRVALEAMAAGTPVIGYECGALPEVIGDGGLLVAEGDTGALEAAVERYLRLPAAGRAAARVRARERASAFTNEKLADRLVEVWRGVVHPHGAMASDRDGSSSAARPAPVDTRR